MGLVSYKVEFDAALDMLELNQEQRNFKIVQKDDQFTQPYGVACLSLELPLMFSKPSNTCTYEESGHLFHSRRTRRTFASGVYTINDFCKRGGLLFVLELVKTADAHVFAVKLFASVCAPGCISKLERLLDAYAFPCVPQYLLYKPADTTVRRG